VSQSTAYDVEALLEYRRVLFRSVTATLRHGTLRRRGTPGLPPQAARVVPFPVTRVTRRLTRVRTICWTFVGERRRTAHNAGRGRRPLSTVCRVDATGAAAAQRPACSRRLTAAPVRADRYRAWASSTLRRP